MRRLSPAGAGDVAAAAILGRSLPTGFSGAGDGPSRCSVDVLVWTSALAAADYRLGARFAGVDRYLGPVSTAIIGMLSLVQIWRVVRFRLDREP